MVSDPFGRIIDLLHFINEIIGIHFLSDAYFYLSVADAFDW